MGGHVTTQISSISDNMKAVVTYKSTTPHPLQPAVGSTCQLGQAPVLGDQEAGGGRPHSHSLLRSPQLELVKFLSNLGVVEKHIVLV